MTLPTKNDVRRAQAANTLQRDAVKRFSEDLETGNQTAQHRANLAWAGALTIDSVVYEVNEQSGPQKTTKEAMFTSNCKASH